MIRFTRGNLLAANVEALVNAVNTVGVMGKGIALAFKQRFPENFREYEAACRAGEVRVGEMFVTAGVELDGPRWIINFPTKQHWRDPTKLEWIQAGLESLKWVVSERRIKSLAVPALGCGNGGLSWGVVRQLIEEAFGAEPNVEVLVYEPMEISARRT